MKADTAFDTRRRMMRNRLAGLGIVLITSAGLCVQRSDATSPLPAPTANIVVRIPARGLAEAGPFDLHAESSIDYGSFVWAELSPADLAHLRASGVPFERREHAYTLRLGEQSFDPLAGVPLVPPGLDRVRVDGGPDLRLVQFSGPSRGAWVDSLESSGLKVVQYIPPHTYVVWGEAVARDAISTHAAVRWVGDFLPAYRLLPRWRSLEGRQEVDVLFYRGADIGWAMQQITAMGGELSDRAVLNGTFETARLRIPGAGLQAASNVPGVYSVQPVPTDGGLRGEMSDQVNVNNVDGSNLAFPGYQAWLAGVGLSGTGVVIANIDDGVAETHPDLLNRFLPCTGTTCGGGASSSHGSHTAGIMAADGSSGTLDGYGFLRGLGVAPGANLIEQLYWPYYLQTDGMLLLMADSYNNGAFLSGNSWGPAGSPRGYDDATLQVDIGVRDADPETRGNQPLTYVLSIMNGYGGTSTQGTPDEAKNIFTIGSTKMQATSGQQYLQINDLSSTSAHGPALDGRIIPHMVAPGCSVDSTGERMTYLLKCGTSMASPHVSGAVALFVEYYRDLPTDPGDPSAALIKAAFIAVARDLAGSRDADGGTLGHPFDSKQGWGRMDLEAVVDPAVSVQYFDNPVVFDDTGEDWVHTVSVDDPNEPVRLMLVWTDAPGHGLGGTTPAWNNDLDLVVEVGGDTYRGNNFGADGWSQPGGSADTMNNTEGVFLGPIPPSSFTIRVVASDINSDAIPGEGDLTDQDFAVVCYNCPEEPGFTLDVAPLTQDICAPADAVYSIEVGQVLGFSDPVTLSASGEPFGTTVIFDPNPVTPPGMSELTIGNTGAAPVGAYSITVEGVPAGMARSRSVALGVADSVPGIAVLSAPTYGATDVPLRPNFRWESATQAVSYTIEIATNGAFSNLIHTAGGLTDTAYDLPVMLERTTQYFWRVQASNGCGAGSDSAASGFTTRDIPAVLLVDDDDNLPDVRFYYTDALDTLGYVYDIWDTGNSDYEPDAATLSQYETVIWFSGVEFSGPAGPGPAGEAALASFLVDQHCLFISSQDYYYDHGLTGFMSEYLGISSVENDVNQTEVTGRLGSVFEGMGPYVLSYPSGNYSDKLRRLPDTDIAFNGNQGYAALLKAHDAYRTTFWGFPFEAIPAGDRVEVMDTVMEWCGNAAPPQPPQPLSLPPNPEHHAPKHRYLSIDTTGNTGTAVTLKVEIVSMKRCMVDPRKACTVDADCRDLCDNDHDIMCSDDAHCPSGGTCVQSGPCAEHEDVGESWFVQGPVWKGPLSVDWVSEVDPAEHSQVWIQNTLHIGGCEIVPVVTYAVSACRPQGGICGDPLLIGTQALPFNAPGNRGGYGDVVGPVGQSPLEFAPPDGVVNTIDVIGYLLTHQNYGTANLPQAHITWIDIHGNGTGNPPQYILNVSDLMQIKFGFIGLPWANPSGNLHPGDCNP